ncbi:Hsp20/alpha crystallin family protein [Candidatus Nitronereus thalassa]|uniref:Hsp20/alpha crystallin family protein n=1 Tax=Candidatus Nitronereus thalassa TaxID=3020898 RepID=A0ABU3KAY7_9BACT|nr:Hsp20/alpha crystallin family protein [Candidatus Nitronereus thalassa]MDT7043362.1 Hsp20/alpha crystallin family protein [Candidatus Nitronereus thalassa]
MELKQMLTPWNWFKKEEETKPVPVHITKEGRDYPIDRLHHEMNQLFDSFFRGFPLSPFSGGLKESWQGVMRPNVDISEGSKHYTITVEVPGVQEKDMELTIADGTLTVRGEKRHEQETHESQYHRVERSYGAFQRVISLPDNANEQEVKAQFKQGVLTITVGKTSQAKSGGRKIVINE